MAMLVRIFVSLAALALFGCGDKHTPSPTPSVGSNSNWLRGCQADSDCGAALSCQCGLCTRSCDADEVCDTQSDALCVQPNHAAAWSCEDEKLGSAVCLPRCAPGSCAEAQDCVDGACVPYALPESELCAPVAATNAEQRRLSDELLALLQERRGSGSMPCSAGEPALVGVTLRLDGRLMCVARVLAADLDAGTARPGIVDASGRDTIQRMNMVGYMPRRWGESFAVQARSPDHALRLMLNDVGNCQRLVDGDFRDVGVANSGEAYVVTIGTPR